MRETFRDHATQQRFAEDGYVVRDLLDADRVAEIRSLVAELHPDASGMHTTIQSQDFDYRARVIEQLPPLLDDVLDDLLDNHDLVTASLAVKWPGPDTVFCTHQDWTMVDEQRFRTVNVWIPLVDVDDQNGALAVLPGSHSVLDHLRCCPMNPSGFVSEGTEVSYQEMDVVPLAAGHALMFDSGLLHGSGPNLTSSAREAVVVVMKPKEAAIEHYHLSDGDSWVAERYEVDTSFFVDFVIGQRPRFDPVGTLEFYGTPRTRSELLAACGREPVEVPPSPLATAPPATAPPATIPLAGIDERPSTMVADATTVGRFRTFVDADLEQQLERDGYVVVDLLGDDVLDQLRELAFGLYVDDAEGFHASNLSPSVEYRRAVAASAVPVIAAAAHDLFVDHEAYTASLLMKWPDETSAFHSHQDWSMVDEHRYRTVNVWCPLEDVATSDGALRVVPGSHRLLDAIRCSPMPPASYSNPGWAIGWEQMVPLEVTRGQVVIFDHALLHSSGPNEGNGPRAAVAAAFKPREAALFHWYLPDPSSDRLERFAIDSDFFASIEIGQRPEYEVAAEDSFTWTERSAAELLQEGGLAEASSSGAEVATEPAAPVGADARAPVASAPTASVERMPRRARTQASSLFVTRAVSLGRRLGRRLFR